MKVAGSIGIGARLSASGLGLLESSPNVRGDIAKLSLAIVEKQKRRLSVAHVAANVAHGFVDMAVGDCEIEPAVEIGIEKNTAKTKTVPGGQTHSRLRRNVFVGFSRELVYARHFL